MASVRVKPSLKGRKGVTIRRTKPMKSSNTPVGPTLSRFTAVWVQENGVPFDTTGFFARLYNGNTLVQTSSFDRYGVVRFSRVRTLTNVVYTLRIFDEDGIEFRNRQIPAGVQTYAVIG